MSKVLRIEDARQQKKEVEREFIKSLQERGFSISHDPIPPDHETIVIPLSDTVKP